MAREKRDPVFSIVTVVRNGINSIESTILSVINQNYQNFEFIIIDGNSNDGTVEVIKKYENYITYWISEPDKGIYDAMNKGILRSNGKYIILLNSDDYFHNNEVLKNIVTKIDSFDIFYVCDVLISSKKGTKPLKLNPQSKFFVNIPFIHTGLIIPKKIYDIIGLYSLEFEIASDIDFVFRLLINNYSYKKIEGPYVIMSDEGISNKKFYIGRNEYKNIYIKYFHSHFKGYLGLFYTSAIKFFYEIRVFRQFVRFLRFLYEKIVHFKF